MYEKLESANSAHLPSFSEKSCQWISEKKAALKTGQLTNDCLP
jgi:hypothetical protein